MSQKLSVVFTAVLLIVLTAALPLAAISFQDPVKYAVGAEPYSICYLTGYATDALYVACNVSNEIRVLTDAGMGNFNPDHPPYVTVPSPIFITLYFDRNLYWNRRLAWISSGEERICLDGNYCVNTGTDPRSVCFADFDGDIHEDFAAAYFGIDIVQVFRNEYGYIPVSDWGFMTAGAGPISICSADFTGDGKIDIAIANYYAQTVTVYRNTSVVSDISFELHATNGTGPQPYSICAADFDGDGLPDIATCDYGHGVTVLRNTGGGFFSGSEQGTNRVDGPTCIVAADFDNDGKKDLAIANSVSDLNDVTILRNTSTVGSISFVVGCFVDDWGWAAQSLCVGDFNDDGQMDIAVANRLSNNISILLNNTSLSVCGDADGSTIITISDAVYLINYIFSGGPAPSPLLSGDVDCNSIVTISDAVYLINYIFAGGGAPCAGCK